MILDRPDLDGLRLYVPGSPDVWLMFHGRRHRIASPTAYDGLFSETTELVAYPDIAEITAGQEVMDGSCLIRAQGGLFIYLLALSAEGDVRRHHVTSYETLIDFGFDMAKVHDVPALLINEITEGRELMSAADRARRR